MSVLPDVLQRDLVTVFCGSAASPTSAAVGAYYARPGNKFWSTLHDAGFTDRCFDPQEFHTVTSYGIGLTDLAKHESGTDAALSPSAYDAGALLAKIEDCEPRHLAFTGKRPAARFLLHTFGGSLADYGLQDARIGETRIFVLPSPSGLATRWWSIEPWRRLAELHRKERESA